MNVYITMVVLTIGKMYSKGLIGNLNSSIVAHRAAIGLDKLFKEAYLNIAQMFKVRVIVVM